MIQSCCNALVAPGSDLAQLFAFGLLMSAGHCLGMCGPLACALSVPNAQAAAHPWRAAGSIASYHAGRLAAYASLGLLLGSLGGLLPQGAGSVVWQAVLSLLAAAALLWVGLGLLGVFPLASLACTSRLSRWLVNAPLAGLPRRFALGVANGFLPCGPVYTVAVAALAAGGPLQGSVAMVAFGAGTVPLLAALALGVRWIGQRARLGLYRCGAALALLMGVQLALRGLAALAWVPHLSVREVVLW